MGFAGSRRLDERRRRRLAGEPNEQRSTTTRRIDAAHTAAPQRVTTGEQSPVLAILPQSQWALASLILVSGAIAVAVVCASFALSNSPIWRPVFDVQSGRMLPFLTNAYCFAASQFCLVIYWYRKRSRGDFSGRYRRWLTSFYCLLFASVCLGTGLHEPLATTISRHLPPADWNTVTMCWSVPVAVMALILGPFLFFELKAFGPSSVLYTSGLLAGTLAVAVQLVGDVALNPSEQLITVRLAAFVACWSMMHAFWWHARQVVRITNEPPRGGRLRTEIMRLVPKLKFRRGNSTAETDESATNENGRPNQPVKSEELTDRPARRRRRQQNAEEDATPEDRADTRPGLLTRVAIGITAPIRALSTRMRARRAARKEAAELKKLEREERRAEKQRRAIEAREQREVERAAAAEAKRQAREEKLRQAEEAKAERAAEKAAAKARAESSRREASAKKKQTEQRVSEPEASENKVGSAGSLGADTGQGSETTAAERRAARKAKRAERRRQQESAEDFLPEELRHDDEEMSSRGGKRRKKKNRRR